MNKYLKPYIFSKYRETGWVTLISSWMVLVRVLIEHRPFLLMGG